MSGLNLKYFVLNPDSSDTDFALASQQAMFAFATSIESVDHTLAEDLRIWVANIQNKVNNASNT